MTRVGLIGDSQGVGMRRPLEAALSARGDSLAFADVETGAGLSKLAEKARVLPSDLDLVIIVCGGGNDDSSVTAPSRWATLVRGVVSAVQAKAPRARIVWAGPMPATSHDAALRKTAAHAQLPGVLGPLGVQWVDGFTLARGLTPGRDGIHYTGTSLTTMAERLSEALPRGGLSVVSSSSMPILLVAGGLGIAAVVLYAITRERRR